MKKLYPLVLPVSLVVLNTLDGVLTAICVHKGWAAEANPLLFPLIKYNIWLFLAVKITANIPFWHVGKSKEKLIRLIGICAACYYLVLVAVQVYILCLGYFVYA